LGCTPNALKEPIKGILVFLIFIGAPRSVTVTSVPQGVSAPHVSGGAGGMGGGGGGWDGGGTLGEGEGGGGGGGGGGGEEEGAAAGAGPAGPAAVDLITAK
jgi:hypothetical protein